MDAFKKELLQLLDARREPFVQMTVAESASHGEPVGPRVPAEDMAQMVNGFFAVLAEALEGGETERRTMYIGTLFPSLRDAGFPLPRLMHGIARILNWLAMDLAVHVPEAHRADASRWLAGFLGGYIADIVAVWLPEAAR